MHDQKQIFDFMQQHLGYDDEQMALFKDNPRNLKVLSRAPALMNKTIVAEVVESHGCNSRHKTGDRFYFDGSGNLITKLNPKRMCIFALQPLGGLIYGLHELFYAGEALESEVVLFLLLDPPDEAVGGDACGDRKGNDARQVERAASLCL